MGKDKLRKFAEIDTFPNVYQLDEGKELKGKWAAQHFKNDHPVVLELACGKGEYAVSLAKMFPKKNFIGVDLKGNRIWRGARTGVDEGITNLAFLRIQIEDIVDFFGENEVDEIWITFPDPQPQDSREKKRLTFPGFLDRYRMFLKPGGKINLKTDNDGLYLYTVEKVEELGLKCHKKTDQLYKSELYDDVLSIKTHYERIYLKHDKNINYIQFSFE
ncbi:MULTISPECIES: tRNA (guanosine(46)-N7)-methyltransferase TrmB [Pedobacter]|uniref:tRNA (guanine-N(7)-)-methyltransferase n=1 Tax=Pedobacter heparinus (strain ATCC 13125 / DSM 2366 / CIP 104194 / JCM 7457 / NBRC 12017 / NCIMB 9290 / NRRL B-14731 / HIM 762-3) TaxID=485917 RepID=C6XXA3_PEDHD|nr:MULTISPECIES: tRNA (guanosine(46)-N7)-methyltransferase TrmB [Pedobacter]ACU06409.1 tRNA (guanine-N(7)-)-methyltransferase [Pedobacter heparinus DSM 2366]MBB5437221.1 tRNA (guanine-N7-)-methyltransferase [Pedobacter sp. AK017]